MCFPNRHSLVVLSKYQKWVKKPWTVEFCFLKLLIYEYCISGCQLILYSVRYKCSNEKREKYCAPDNQSTCIKRLSAKPHFVLFIRAAFEIWGTNLAGVTENVPVARKDRAQLVSLFLHPSHSKKKTLFFFFLMRDCGTTSPAISLPRAVNVTHLGPK